MANSSSNDSAGFRMPPEWGPQMGVWFSWPHRVETWPERLPRVQRKMVEIYAIVARFERVFVICPRADQGMLRELLAEAGMEGDRVQLFDIANDDAWCRDHGPVFVNNPVTGEQAVVDFAYNAWGGKYPPWDDDNRVAERVAEELGLRRFVGDFVCEGGALEVNGEGLLLTTRSVLLNPNRNPDLGEERISSELKRLLGVEEVVWLSDGLADDDTDGHIDNLARFFKPDGLIITAESDPAGPNYVACQTLRAELEAWMRRSGREMELVELPLPQAMHASMEGRGELLPANHTNFLVINGAVLLPVFGQPDSDDRAVGIVGDCFPGREIIPVDCTDIIHEGGAIHCLSQQQPAVD